MILRLVTAFFFAPFLLILGLYIGVAYSYDPQEFLSEPYVRSLPTRVLDARGGELFRFEQDKHAPISYNKLPKHVVHAFLTAEDHNFFYHHGISVRGIIRSFVQNIRHRRIVQGASTITQQLVRLSYLSHERTYFRKIKEILLAFYIERKLSKEQIFERYINSIYFGRGIYGIEAAAKRFWGISASQLSLAQAATLAAVPKSARFYSPLNAPAQALKRRNAILRVMPAPGVVTGSECAAASKEPLGLSASAQQNPIRLYLHEWIRLWLERQWGRDQLYSAGLTVKTTIDPDLQQRAENLFKEHVKELRGSLDEKLDGGLMSLDVMTGKIRASVGGYSFTDSQYNRSFMAVRQMGSIFKLLVYSVALEQGEEMDHIYIDEPISMKLPNGTVWEPRNVSRRFDGPMTLVRALNRSNNIITVKLLQKVGYQPVIDRAHLCGLSRNLVEYPALALGIAEATVQEAAGFFNVFANNGVYVEPYLIEWVKNEAGVSLYKHHFHSHKVMSEEVNAKMVHALGNNLRTLSKEYKTHQWLDAECFGKTGSTNGATSMWYAGCTPELTTVIFMGRDDAKALPPSALAISSVFPLWRLLMKDHHHARKFFYRPAGLREKVIDLKTGREVSQEKSYSTGSILVNAKA